MSRRVGLDLAGDRTPVSVPDAAQEPLRDLVRLAKTLGRINIAPVID